MKGEDYKYRRLGVAIMLAGIFFTAYLITVVVRS